MAARARSFIGEVPTPGTAHAPAALHQRVETIVFDAKQAAAFIGVSDRTFHAMRPRLPRAIALLGPLRPRWRRADLEAWVAGLPTIDEPAPEPAPMRKGREKRNAEAAQAGDAA
jgi:hypothetical protein